MNRNRILTAVVTLVLGGSMTACSLSPAFRKETGPPTSYMLTRMGGTAYRIDLRGMESASRHAVTLHLLKRAASVTLENGYDYFVVSGGEVRGENEMRATPFAGASPESPSGQLAEGSAGLSQRFSGSLLFQVFKGDMPADNPLTFDARALAR